MDKQSSQDKVINSDYSAELSIVNYYTRQLLRKNYCAIFLFGRRIVALKLIYFTVERGCSFKSYPGLILKLELKSPTTVVLLDLSYFHAL